MIIHKSDKLIVHHFSYLIFDPLEAIKTMKEGRLIY